MVIREYMVENFELKYADYEKARKKGYGIWFCKKCGNIAETEHNKPECHLCEDWNGCGRDCRLSKIYCTNCGVVDEV